jgi:uncharacterized protein
MQLQRISLMFFVSIMMAVSAYFVCTQFFATAPYCAELEVGLASLYMWIPGVFALLYMKQDKMPVKILKKPSQYCFAALLLPVLLVGLGIVYTLPFAHFSTEGIVEAAQKYHLNFSSSTVNMTLFLLCLYGIAVVASFTVNFVFALGEELFWRGYLWEHMKQGGFWRASFNIGFLWGLWNAPMILLFGINYPHHRLLGVVWMIVWCLLVTPMVLYMRMKDNSLMAPTLLHAMLNAFSPIGVVFFPQAQELLGAPLGLAGMLALLSVNCYFLQRKPRAFVEIASL